MNKHARDLHQTSTMSFTNEAGCWLSADGYSLPIAGPLPSRAIADAHAEKVGEDNWKEHLSCWREFVRVYRLPNGTILNEDREPVSDPLLSAQVERMRAEDAETLAARSKLADDTVAERYNGNAQARIAIRSAIEFNPRGWEPSVRDGIDWYWVGRNASHQFYMGVRVNPDSSVSLFSGSWEHEEGYWTKEVKGFQGGYYGHF